MFKTFFFLHEKCIKCLYYIVYKRLFLQIVAVKIKVLFYVLNMLNDASLQRIKHDKHLIFEKILSSFIVCCPSLIKNN